MRKSEYQHGSGHVHTQPGIKRIEITVPVVVQVFSVRVFHLIQRIHIEQSVHRLRIRPAIVEQIRAYLAIKLIVEPFLLRIARQCSSQQCCQ